MAVSMKSLRAAQNVRAQATSRSRNLAVSVRAEAKKKVKIGINGGFGAGSAEESEGRQVSRHKATRISELRSFAPIACEPLAHSVLSIPAICACDCRLRAHWQAGASQHADS